MLLTALKYLFTSVKGIIGQGEKIRFVKLHFITRGFLKSLFLYLNLNRKMKNIKSFTSYQLTVKIYLLPVLGKGLTACIRSFLWNI